MWDKTAEDLLAVYGVEEEPLSEAFLECLKEGDHMFKKEELLMLGGGRVGGRACARAGGRAGGRVGGRGGGREGGRAGGRAGGPELLAQPFSNISISSLALLVLMVAGAVITVLKFRGCGIITGTSRPLL